MVKDKLGFVKKVLEDHPATRSDGNATFLNVVAFKLFGNKLIDFNNFNVESYTRARRRVMEQNPHLDDRTIKTSQAEETVRKEMR